MLEKLKQLKTTALDKVSPNKEPEDAVKHLVALDIGTEFVKALIAKVDNDGLIEIIGSGRKRQGLGDMQAGAIADIGKVVENCDEALNIAEQQAGVSVQSAVVGIAGELVKGTTSTVRVSRKQPKQPMDMTEVERIIKLVQQRAEKKARKQLAYELGGKQIEVRLVNSALVGLEIDGYPVTNPIGFQGREVVVQLYTAFAPLVHIGALERAAELLDLDLIAVAAEPFGVARSVIGNDTSASMSAILVDVGGGTTDIAIVHEGGVQGTKMFGIGGRAYTRSIERAVNTDFDDAEQLKLSLDSNAISTKQQDTVEQAVESTLTVWVNGLDLALSEFRRLDHLPHAIYLCGGGSSLKMLVDRLHDTNWYSQLPFTRKPIVEHIHPNQVVGIKDNTGTVNDHTYITAMGLLRVGVDTVQSAGGGDTIRDKIDRILHV